MPADLLQTNKDLQDSIKDLSERFAKSKNIELIHNANDADINLVVVQRGIGQASFNSRFKSYGQFFGNVELTQTIVIAPKTYWLSTVLIAGNYKKEFFAGYANQGLVRPWLLWSQDAKDVADNVITWIAANSAQLKNDNNQPRPTKSPGPKV